MTFDFGVETGYGVERLRRRPSGTATASPATGEPGDSQTQAAP
jgi:hypothetical protein